MVAFLSAAEIPWDSLINTTPGLVSSVAVLIPVLMALKRHQDQADARHQEANERIGSVYSTLNDRARENVGQSVGQVVDEIHHLLVTKTSVDEERHRRNQALVTGVQEQVLNLTEKVEKVDTRISTLEEKLPLPGHQDPPTTPSAST